MLIVSFLFLAVGVGVLFGYCNGSTGFNVGYPVSASNVKIDITTAGVPALLGSALTLLGVGLLTVTFLAALVGEFQRRDARVMEDKAVARPWH